jgi:transposase-like protein
MEVKRNGHSRKDDPCQKYVCKECGRNFDDLTHTVFSGHHQPLKVWVLCLYFMGLNLSNHQIAQELELCESDVQKMTTTLRHGVEQKTPDVELSGTVEMDEVYVVAGHKGHPSEVKKKAVTADETG